MTRQPETDEQKNNRERDQARRNKELQDIRRVLSDPEGRRLWWRILEYCGAFKTPMADTPEQTHVNIGKQQVGFFLIGEMQTADPNKLNQLQREYKSEVINNA